MKKKRRLKGKCHFKEKGYCDKGSCVLCGKWYEWGDKKPTPQSPPFTN